MPVADLYFKRLKRLESSASDVFVYDELPRPLRVQIVFIWREILGESSDYANNHEVHRLFNTMVRILCKELGIFELERTSNSHAAWEKYFLDIEDVNIALTMIEMSGRAIEQFASLYDYRRDERAKKKSESAIEEINERMREHAVGYAYAKKEIVRVDSEFLHSEAVIPTLKLLQEKMYAGAQAEFLKAHADYRAGETKNALTECLKALESALTAICEKRGWAIAPNANVKGLFEVVLAKELVPAYWQSHFSGLRATLESGIPTPRNKESAHGQGVDVVQVPMHVASYVLHQTAATLLFLAEADKAM